MRKAYFKVLFYSIIAARTSTWPLRNMLCLISGREKKGIKRFTMAATIKYLDFPSTLKNQREHHKLGGQVVSGHIK